ncbi:MAG: protein DpdG [Chloroflexi bacterium]|nr:protein DpdG [Chloroflexota bacterium]
MSVVTTWVAVPNRIEAVVRFLSQRRSVPHDELTAMLSPSSLRSPSSVVVPQVIAESQQLGLIEHDGEGHWQLTEEAASTGDLRRLLRRILLAPEDATRRGQGRVALAMAWFLTQDSRAPLTIGENWRMRVLQECPESDIASELANTESCRQFAFWVAYLGFGWRFGSGIREAREVLVADPSVAIESVLREEIPTGEPIPIAEVMGRLAEACPVIEGGVVREEVEEQLADPRPDGQLSRSTSFALRRLEARGVVSMPIPAADALVNTLDLGTEHRPVSHIQLREDTE